jgi:biopolymer transport protein ExbB
VSIFFLRLTALTLLWFAASTFPARAQAEDVKPKSSPTAADTSDDQADAKSDDGNKGPRILGDDISVIEIIKRGRYLMIPILLCSIVALGFTIERAIALRRSTHIPNNLSQRVLERVMAEGAAGPDAGIIAATETPSSLGRLLAAALTRTGTTRREMVQAVLDESGRLMYDLRRNTRVLGIVGGVAPLLGLLGTVVGMIRAFDKVSEVGLGRASELAGGIAEALLTTGAGLMVAIPSYLLYQFFKGRGDDIVREVEDLAERFVIEYHRRLAARGSAAPADAVAEASSDRPADPATE